MLLTLTTTLRPATDLGFLLHKHPDRQQTFPLPFGQAHVFYPEATEDRCTAALLLDIDPVGLVRRGRGGGSFALAEYVNDRPYVASSFMSVALVNVFKSAMAGTCKGHEALAASAIPLEAVIIYGPEYLDPTQIERLRSRSLGRKRSLAVREFGLGIEALERFVRREPLYRVHECVFGVLAMESEPVDPRL